MFLRLECCRLKVVCVVDNVASMIVRFYELYFTKI